MAAWSREEFVEMTSEMNVKKKQGREETYDGADEGVACLQSRGPTRSTSSGGRGCAATSWGGGGCPGRSGASPW